MYGFTITYTSNKVTLNDKEVITHRCRNGKLFSCGYTYFDKFGRDKVFFESDSFIVGLDGVVLNLRDLKKNHNTFDLSALIIELWTRYKELFAKNLKGDFTGFIFDKKAEEFLFFGNQTATNTVCYFSNGNDTIISPNIGVVVAFCRVAQGSVQLDTNAVYTLFTYGAMLENQTLVKGIFRLHAGEVIVLKKGKVEIEKYHSFNDVSITVKTQKDAIDKLENAFQTALDLEYEKDLEYGYKHLATLSGGLDSRMNVVLANSKGYKNDLFCFSESDYLDERIAKKIARDLELKIKTISLENGRYLHDLSENVNLYNGAVSYISSAHLNSALKKLELQNYGLIHTGQIGDGILGGFVTEVRDKKINYRSKMISTKFLHKVNYDKRNLEKYSSEEVFKLLNRVCNFTNCGSFAIANHQSYLVSPFMDTDFIETCLSISPKLKVGSKIYINWIKKCHPEIAKYKWERTGFKPNANWKTEVSRYTNKIKKEYYKILNKEYKLSMNPFEYWYKNNTDLKTFYNNYYWNSIRKIQNSNLKGDFDLMFRQGSFIEKSAVISVLEFIKQHDLKI